MKKLITIAFLVISCLTFAGDKIKVSAKVKGNGKAILGVYLYNDKGKWIGTNMFHEFDVGPEWKSNEFVFELKNFKDKKYKFLRIKEIKK